MSNNFKFELTDESMLHEGDRVFRIRALTDISNDVISVKEGELGGFVEFEDNLGYIGDDRSWIDKDSVVKGESSVVGDSNVLDGSVVEGLSSITGASNVVDGSTVYDSQVESASRLSGVGASNATITKSKVDMSNVSDSLIDRSVVENGSSIYTSTIKSSKVNGSEIEVSDIEESSFLEGNEIYSSTVYDSSFLKDNEVAESTVMFSKIASNERFGDDMVREYVSTEEVSLTDEDLAGLSPMDDGLSL